LFCKARCSLMTFRASIHADRLCLGPFNIGKDKRHVTPIATGCSRLSQCCNMSAPALGQTRHNDKSGPSRPSRALYVDLAYARKCTFAVGALGKLDR
jgi:hypothetical protein